MNLKPTALSTNSEMQAVFIYTKYIIKALLKVHRCAGRKAGRTVCAGTNELAACFFLLQDSVMVLSATHRYKKKYVTTLLYKPI